MDIPQVFLSGLNTINLVRNLIRGYMSSLAPSDASQRHSLAWLKEKLQFGSQISCIREPILAAELELMEISAVVRLERSIHGKD